MSKHGPRFRRASPRAKPYVRRSEGSRAERLGLNRHFRTSPAQNGEQSPRISVVAKCLAEVDKEIPITWSEDKARAELKRILAQPMLPVTSSFGSCSCCGIVAAQEVKEISRLQFHRLVGNAVSVHQQRKGNAGLVSKQARVVHVAQPDRSQRRPSLFELVFLSAQLRDVLAAEDSPIVAEKDDDSSVLLPQRAQAHFAPASLRQNHVCQF